MDDVDLNVHMDDIYVYIVDHQVDDYDVDLNVKVILLLRWRIMMVNINNVKVMFILLHRWVDERKEQEEVEALREEVSGEDI